MGSASYTYKSGYVYPTRSKEFKLNSVYTISATANPGYHFTSWSDGGTQSHDITITGSNTYTANFAANTYTVHFDGNGSTGGSTADQGFTYGTPQNLRSNGFTRTGHKFIGWATSADRANAGTVDYTDGQSVTNLTATPNGEFNLYAVWQEMVTFTINPYTNGTVTVTPNDGSGAFTTGSRDLAVGTMVTLNFAAAEHYHISYVTLKGNQFTNGTAYTLQSGDGTVTLTANFLPDTYTLNYRDQGDADYSGSNLASLPASHTYDAATALVDGVKEGYTFNGWYEDAECTGDAVTTIAANSITAAKTLYAKWTKNITYRTLRVNNADHGTVSVAGATGAATDGDGYKTYTVAVGAEVTLNAAVNTDVAVDKYFYEFKNWNVSAGGVTVSENSFTMPDADVTLAAQFDIASTIVLKDGETDFYGAYSELVTTLKGAAVDVRLDRNGGLKKNTWSTICLPFNYYNLEETDFEGKIWTYQGATGDWENGLDLHFAKTGDMEANTPYLYYNTTAVSADDLLFDDVVLTDGTPKDIHGGSVTFKGVVQRTQMTGENKNKLFLQDNKIYYLGSSGTVVRAYRAYFEVDEQDTPAGMQPRVRIVMHGDNATDIEVIDMDGGTQTRSNAEVRKYMENGILIIEREGVRYDATGAKIN